jgi:hypothetical protein
LLRGDRTDRLRRVGEIRACEPARLFVGILSRHASLHPEIEATLAARYGAIAARSGAFPFTFTDYYRAEMGGDLLRSLLLFDAPFDPGELAPCKLFTNALEAQVAKSARFLERRPVNVDPGYLTLSKLVLASTKDHAHRVYVGSGIHAEVTLAYREGSYRALPWTYPDYRSETYHAFLAEARTTLERGDRKKRTGGA